MDFKEIIDSWLISFTPNDLQKKLAEERLTICEKCDSLKEIVKRKKWSHVCGECGCPVAKKVFTNRFNACPLSKWGEIDKRYFETKENKTII